MANETKKTKKTLEQKRFIAVAAAAVVLLLALIVVSAFAYQWNGEKKDYRNKWLSVRSMQDFTENNAPTELANSQMQIAELDAKVSAYEKTIKDYEKILEENDLLPAD